MKAITATTLVIDAVFAGAPVAGAQNSTPTPKVLPSPSNIDKGVLPTKPSGAEARRSNVIAYVLWPTGFVDQMLGNCVGARTTTIVPTLTRL
jgi:hypothetical protein